MGKAGWLCKGQGVHSGWPKCEGDLWPCWETLNRRPSRGWCCGAGLNVQETRDEGLWSPRKPDFLTSINDNEVSFYDFV